MTFTISVAVLGQLDWTRRCIDSIYRHVDDFELIVQDNGSDKETLRYLCGLDHRTRLVLHPKNIGFGEAHNISAGMAKGRYLLILNNDLELVFGVAEAMRGVLETEPNTAIVGVDGTCCTLDEHGNGAPGEPFEYVEGSCLMMRTDEARAYGPFDPIYQIAYYEDSDLSLRVRSDGRDITYVPYRLPGGRAVTSSTMDLSLVKAFNHRIFEERWSRYLKGDRSL